MVFVQSFWSRPFLNVDSNEYNYRVSAGFLDKRYFYYCWTLSYLSLKSFGGKCLLITDDLGKYLLTEALGMEYDEVRLEFNALENLSTSYWAIPKLNVYKNMKEPFLHFDGDLILYPGFKDLGLEKRDLVFEFKNESFSDSHLKSIEYLDDLLFNGVKSGVKTLQVILSSQTNLANSYTPFEPNPTESNPIESNPPESNSTESFAGEACAGESRAIEPSLSKDSGILTGELNCGIIGGRNYKFLNEFASWSLDMFNNNLGKLDSEFLKYNKNFINSYFEQYLLYRYISHTGKAFSCIYENDPRQLYQRDFFLPASNTTRIMTHFILNLKIKYSLEIELSLRLNHPEWYARINDLIDRNII